MYCCFRVRLHTPNYRTPERVRAMNRAQWLDETVLRWLTSAPRTFFVLLDRLWDVDESIEVFELVECIGRLRDAHNLADGQAQVEALNTLTVTMAELLGRVMPDRDSAFTKLAEKDARVEELRLLLSEACEHVTHDDGCPAGDGYMADIACTCDYADWQSRTRAALK